MAYSYIKEFEERGLTFIPPRCVECFKKNPEFKCVETNELLCAGCVKSILETVKRIEERVRNT